MLLMEILQQFNDNENININDRYKKHKNDKVFMNIETDLKNLKCELKEMELIYNNLDANINNFLNNDIILNALYIGLIQFKASYNIYKDTEIIINNKNIVYVTKSHIKTVEKVIYYYDVILNKLKSNANAKQQEKFKNLDKFYNIV